MTLTPKASRPSMPGYGILPPDQGLGLKPWSYAVARLTKARSYWIATTRPDGRPHAVPIWGLWLDDHFMFSTGAQSRKARNLRENPHVTIGAEPADDAIVIEGKAALVEEAARQRDFAKLYGVKYAWDSDNFNEPVYAVRPVAAYWFSSTPGDFVGGTTRWSFE